jgi:serine/threonine protein kinase
VRDAAVGRRSCRSLVAASCRRACTPLCRWSIRFSQPAIRFQLALFAPSHRKQCRYHVPVVLLGSTLGHYHVLRRLGEGGMGETFLIDDLKLQRRAALKLISSALTIDEGRRHRFLQEARLAASIDHPHIAAI